jgi:hypothetical protein
MEGHTDVVTMLVKAGTDINHKDSKVRWCDALAYCPSLGCACGYKGVSSVQSTKIEFSMTCKIKQLTHIPHAACC